MNVLFVSSFYLYKKTRYGGSKRLYEIAREIEIQHNLSLICFDGSNEIEANQPHAPEFKKQLFLNCRSSFDSLRKIFTPAADVRSLLKKQQGKIDTFIGQLKFDIVILAYPLALSFMDMAVSRGEKISYLEDDLIFETYRRENIKNGNVFRKLLKGYQYQQVMPYYKEQLHKIKNFIGISPEEIEVMRSHFPWLNSRLVKYGIDLTKYKLLDFKNTPTIGFIGNYNHKPNSESLWFFLNEIYPVLKENVNNVELIIAGRNLPESMIQSMSSDVSITCLGDVPELQLFYEKISFFINPIISGRGLRTKLVEAAAFGRPILSTALGAEGLGDLRIQICEKPEEYLNGISKMLDSESETISLIKYNRDIIQQRYTVQAITKLVLEDI